MAMKAMNDAKMPLNIAFYTDSYLPAVDGVVTSINNFASELERRGHKVYIFTAGKKAGESAYNVFFSKGVRFRKYPQYTFAVFPYLSASRARRLKIDLVHVHTPFSMGMSGLIASKVNRVPIVGSFHTLFTDKSVIKEYVSSNSFIENMANRYSWSYARFFYNKCDMVMAPSRAVEELLHRHRITETRVVENGVDTRLFNPRVNGNVVRRMLVGDTRKKLVMYVGRVSIEKKLDVMINAARLLRKKDIVFAVIGSGPSLEHYRAMVRRHGLEGMFRFLGFIDNAKLPEYYAAADVFCIPSTFETQGIVSIEAMACGKPVVGADYLALKELIKDGYNGEKFAPNDASGCAAKIEKVINDVGRYKGMAATAVRYSIESTTDRLLDVYGEIIGQ